MQNNLSQKEIVLFYEFLHCYESNLKQLENEKSIGEIAKEFKSKVKEFRLNINVVNRGKVPQSDTLNSNEIFMTLSKNTQMLSFLNHLRNSIAHILIKKVDNNFELGDKNGSTITMSGIINELDLKYLINIFINNFKI